MEAERKRARHKLKGLIDIGIVRLTRRQKLNIRRSLAMVLSLLQGAAVER